jgi:peptidylprolyl isomerase
MSMKETIKKGDTISVHYTGKFESGEVFDTSEGRMPLKFTTGTGQLVKGFDNAVIGMSVGDKKTVRISPTEGYGERNEDMIIDMPKTNMPEDMKVEVGMTLQLADQAGNPVPATVHEICEDVIKMDANHPLAGKTLVFDIEVAETGLKPDTPASCGEGCGGCSGNCS